MLSACGVSVPREKSLYALSTVHYALSTFLNKRRPDAVLPVAVGQGVAGADAVEVLFPLERLFGLRRPGAVNSSGSRSWKMNGPDLDVRPDEVPAVRTDQPRERRRPGPRRPGCSSCWTADLARSATCLARYHRLAGTRTMSLPRSPFIGSP